ncbi:twin-arginine translocation signal domain-containing protein [Pseudomonas sp. I2]|uniref:twin-arginine translocation signal domain-containing protein n=1 Tax=Pseudomonas sp. I2 TaxID=1338438 RepID=UPI0034D74AF1
MPTRRDFMKQLTAAAGLGVVASMGLGLSAPRVRAATASNWYMPDEHAPQERVFLAFAASLWRNGLGVSDWRLLISAIT